MVALRPSTPSPKLRTGDLYSERFEVLDAAGSGLAEVYRARDVKTGDVVALKVLRKVDESDDELRARLEKEAQLLSMVQHPGVVRAIDFGRAPGGESFLVMEYLDGETLRSFLERERCMSANEALPLFLNLARALSAAHDVGIIHRDMKPDNVFLTGPIGAPHSVHVLDFGLARCPEFGDEPPLVLGTFEYMAPEQVVTDPADTRSDVYGFGAVLFRALTGELPFDTEGGAPLLAHHLLSAAPPPSWLVEGLSDAVDTIILTALRKHPDNRYANMSLVIEDLERAIRGDEALGAPDRVRPDIYVPQSTLGRQALQVLGRRHGHSLEPNSPNPRDATNLPPRWGEA